MAQLASAWSRWRARVASDAGALGLVAGLKLLLHLATRSGYGVFRDELYYLACADHLALGYVDHPPLSIAVLWLERALLGDSLAAIRLVPALAGAGVVFLSGWMARELGGGRAAQVLAAVCAFAAPYFLAVSHFYSLNVLDVVFWELLCWLAIRILAGNWGRGWIAFGLVAGVGLQNKYPVAALGLAVATGLLLTRERRHLRERRIWLGGALALAVLLPHLLWQWSHGWPSLEFIANARSEKIHSVAPGEFLAGQILLVQPLALPVWAAGLAALLFSASLRRLRPLGIAFVVLFALFLGQQAKVYYLSPIYPLLFAAGSVALARFFRRRRLRWAMGAAIAAIALGGAATAPMAMPLLAPQSVIRLGELTGLEEPRTEVHERRGLPQLFADMHGWRELVETLARVHRGLAPAERSEVVILARNYGEAGAVDYLGSARGLPPVISGHNSYHLWGPGRYRGRLLIVLGGSAAELSRWFDEVQRVDTVRCRYCMPYQDGVPVHLCRRLKVSIEEFWAAVKRYV